MNDPSVISVNEKPPCLMIVLNLSWASEYAGIIAVTRSDTNRMRTLFSNIIWLVVSTPLNW